MDARVDSDGGDFGEAARDGAWHSDIGAGLAEAAPYHDGDSGDVRRALDYFGGSSFPYFEFEPPSFPDIAYDEDSIASSLTEAPSSVSPEGDTADADLSDLVAADDADPGGAEPGDAGQDDAEPLGDGLAPEDGGDGLSSPDPWLPTLDHTHPDEAPFSPELEPERAPEPGHRTTAASAGRDEGTPDASRHSAQQTPLGDLFRRIG